MKKRIEVLILTGILFVIAGCSGAKEEPLSTNNYALCKNKCSCYDGGALLMSDRRLCLFDEESCQILPLCTRAECKHEVSSNRSGESECPAVYLGARASSLAVYEGKIWYVYLEEGNGKWEFWTADLNGENHTRMFTISGIEAVPGGTSLFYRNYYYTMKMDFYQDVATGETYPGYQMVAISLSDGAEEKITEAFEAKHVPYFVGVYEDKVYYTANQMDEDKFERTLYCVSRTTGKTETIISSKYLIADMNENWLVYGQVEEGGKMVLVDLDTGEKKTIYDRKDRGKLATVELSGDKLLGTVWHEETEEYHFFIYDMEQEEYRETPCYKEGYSNWIHVGEGWLTSLSKDASEVDINDENEDFTDYFYIREEDLI